MLGLELRLKGLKVRFITDPTNDISIMSIFFKNILYKKHTIEWRLELLWIYNKSVVG